MIGEELSRHTTYSWGIWGTWGLAPYVINKSGDDAIIGLGQL
jgi:hypothetical protein